ncbi:MAG: hypothetical protein QOK25_2721, partial [Thermoleophilaceae bacterium]|nr:hypothetical protein [Thermoleophilaceae bacterium]
MTILNLTTRELPGKVHLELSGELDIATAPKLDEEVRRLEAEGHELIVIDLRGLQ